MLRKIACLFAFLLVVQQGIGQNFYSTSEYGVSLGASQYFGDLNDNYGINTITPAIGGFVRYHLNPYISLKGVANLTRVGYDDKFSGNDYNKRRNLNFKSNILEACVQAEFNFFRFFTGEHGNRWTPYLTGGVGVFYYNPYTELNGRNYDLRPLGTEGQNAGFSDRKYGKFSMCFPIGVGVKYWLTPGINLGVELADRLTLTDYIDDVSNTYVGADLFPTDPQNPNPAFILQDRSILIDGSEPLGRAGKQRGNSSTKDQYMMLLIHLSFQLKVYKCPAYIGRGITEF